MTCAALETLETIAAWVLGELPPDESERFEEHYFACDACTGNAQRMQRLVVQLGQALPPVLTVERRRALASRHPEMPAIDVRPGERARIRLGGSAPVGIWIMRAPLGAATRVDLEARSVDGAFAFALSDVPFDAERGEVVLACQAHYRSLPGLPELHVRLTTSDASGQRPVGTYVLDHEFDVL